MNTEQSHWKKVAGIIAVVAGIITILTFYFTYKNDMYAHSGVLAMHMSEQEVYNNDTRTICICVGSSATRLSDINITPCFNNASKYPIHDFDLRYQVESTGFLPQANTLYERIPLEGHSCLYKYQENTLYQFAEVHHPFFINSFPAQNGHYTIKARATYAGALPYNYTVDIWVRLVNRDRNQTLDDWKKACTQTLRRLPASSGAYDVYYCSNGRTDHESGSDFAHDFRGQPTPPATTPARTTPTSQTKVEYTKPQPQSNKALKIVSHDRQVEGNATYLSLTFNQTLPKDTSFVVTFYRKQPHAYYKAIAVKGNGTNTCRVYLPDNDDDFSTFGLPKWNDSYKENVRFEKQVVKESGKTYLRVTNTSAIPILVETHLKDGKMWWVPIGGTLEGRNYNWIENTDPEDVTFYHTAKMKKTAPQGNEIATLIFQLFMILVTLGGGVLGLLMFYWICYDDIKEKIQKGGIKWSDIELEWFFFPAWGVAGLASGIYLIVFVYSIYF